MTGKYDVKACGAVNDDSNLFSPGQKGLLGMEKGLTDSCGVCSDGNSGLEKQPHFSVSDHATNNCESSKTPERERNCLGHDCSSSSDGAKENTDESRLSSAVTFTSRNSELKADNCAERSTRAVPHCNMPTGSTDMNDCDISVYSPRGIDPMQNFPTKGGVSIGEGERVGMESKESICKRTNELWLGAGEDESKSLMPATYRNNQLKGESSYNSTNVILTASSDESCLEILQDIKSGELNKHSYNNASRYSNLKGSLEGPQVKSSVLAPEVQMDMENSLCFGDFLPQKHCIGGVVDNAGRRDCNKLLETAEDSNPVNVGAGGIWTRNVPKKGIEEIPKVKTCYEPDNALEVVRRVAKQVEQEVGIHKEAPETCFPLQERSDETVYLGSDDSAASSEDCCEERESKNLFNNEQDKHDSNCSTKDEGNPEMSMRSEKLCLDIKEASQDTCSSEKKKPIDSLNGRVSFPPTVKPEVITTSDRLASVSMFNLTENILANEVDDYKNSVRGSASCYADAVSKPTAVVAKFGIPLCLPKPDLQLDREPTGWMGSSSTSAFRPTYFPESFRSTKPSSECRNNGIRSLKSIGIDLNISVEGSDCDGEFVFEKCEQEKSSVPKFSVETCSTRTERFNNDLNCICENDDQCLQPNPQTSPLRLSGIAFDLNDDPPSADACNDTQQSGHGTPVLGGRNLDDHAVKFPGSTREPDPKSAGSTNPADSSYMRSISQHAKPVMTAALNIFPQVEHLQNSAALQHRSSYAAFLPATHLPLRAFSYGNAVFVDPNYCLSSNIYGTGAIPYVTNLQPTPFFPQMPGSVALPAFSRVPHPVHSPGRPNKSEMAITRPGLNLDGWVTSSDCGSQGENGRGWFIPVHIARTEEQMRSLQQPAIPMKRKEPEGASDSYQLGFKRHGPRFP